MNRRWFEILLLLAVVAMVAAGALMAAGPGTDAAAVEHVEAQGYRPWAASLLTPGSAGMERVLFGLQAALGAAVLAGCYTALRRGAGGGRGAGGRRGVRCRCDAGGDGERPANPEPTLPIP